MRPTFHTSALLHDRRRSQRLREAEPQASKSLADQIAGLQGAITAKQLSQLLSVSAISIYKLAKRGALPCFKVGSSVRFCPKTIARWLRERGG